MSQPKILIATLSNSNIGQLTRCIHTQKELTELLEFEGLNLILLSHGLVTQKDLDEN